MKRGDLLLYSPDELAAPGNDVREPDASALATTYGWARRYLCSPHPELGRRGPVCPYTRSSLDNRLFFMSSVRHEHHQTGATRTVLNEFRQWFRDLQAETSEQLRYLVTILVILPRFDPESPAPLEALHREMKDDFVADGLMIGQFHPRCDVPGLWNESFRPLRSPLPMLAIREMVPSDLPFLVDDHLHADAYLRRYAPGLPSPVRQFVVDRIVGA
ncbi:MAG TPA: hypothetical protein VGL60_01860 [Acidimicrobiales bacterium]